MTIRLGIAVAAGGALVIGLVSAVSALVVALGHPVSQLAAERIGVLFLTLPFTLTGIAGALLCTSELGPRTRMPLLAGWTVLTILLCAFGPLAGPYGALFDAATGLPGAWSTSWPDVGLWHGGALATVTIGLARLPILLVAGGTGLLLLAEEAASLGRRLARRLSQPRGSLRPHLPRRAAGSH